MSVADSAVGAILEIPPQALDNIQKAENAIKKLAAVSAEAAGNVNLHWGEVATNGLQKFIDKLAEAKNAMNGLGTINVTLNTNAAVQSTEQLSNATQKTSADVSKAVQDMAQSYDSLAKVNISGVASIAEKEVLSIEQIKTKIKELEATINIAQLSIRDKNDKIIDNPNLQRLADEKKAWQELLRIRTEATEVKDKALSALATKQDKANLDNQKTLLQQILQYQKDINTESTRQERVTKLGGTIPQADIDNLQKYKDKLEELTKSYDKLKVKMSEMTDAGQKKFNKADIDYELAKARELTTADEKRGQALQMVSKYLSETKLKAAGISSREEGVYMNEQVAVYQHMIAMIKKRGEVEAQVASQGYAQTSAQTNLLQTIQAEYDRLEASLSKVTGRYTEIDRVVANAFGNAKTMQEAENAAKLSESYQKAAQAAQKVAEAEAKAEEKAIAAGDKIIAQKEAQIAKQEQAEQKAAQNYEKWWLSALSKRAEAEAKIGLKLKDTSSIEASIQSVNAKLQQESQKLNDIAVNAGIAKQKLDDFLSANNGFNISEALSQRTKLNAELGKLDYQKEIANDNDKPFYEHRIKATIQALDELRKKIDTFRQLESQADGSYQTRLSQREIKNLTEELNRLEKELLNVMNANAAINTEIGKGSTAKSLASEYANLTKRLQEVNDVMNKFQSSNGTVNSASFQALQNEWENIMARRKEIERMDIAEVNQYRTQLTQSAYQADLSAFVQAEAQKTAEAKKQAEQQSNDRLQAYQKYFNTYQGAMAAVNRLGTRGGQWEDTYENRARVIKNLEAAIRNLKSTDADYEKKLKDLTDALVHLKEAQKGVNNALKQKPEVGIFEANQAKHIAEQTKTLKDYERAYKLLIEVMKTIPQGNVWDSMNANAKKMKQNIDEIKKKMGEFHKQTSSTSNVMGQLQGRIAAAFSVGAITGFLKKVTEVRGQFELQRVALGAIIQDRDEANKIFTHVQNMALESPFNIMQLEKATKQIAAFGFETKKLVPTMKMFADISAGLGVEIDRLVLVMGHLKARNYLEGTMVRQFTNMGFNVLGELSKYYSELEDRMVSVGEVQDRVKKKMISFEDVEDVLKRVTSAGGMFYDMQKKQSDSIWGLQQRIKDATDLMLNEIGQSNEGIIKWILNSIRELIKSWRDLKPYIVSTVAAMTSYMVVATGFKVLQTTLKGLQISWILITQGINAAKAAQQSLNVTMMSNPYAAAIAALAALATYIWQVSTATNKLEEDMERIGSDMVDSLNDSIVTFKQLADTISDTNSTYTDRTEALNEMRRVYADILPKEKLEIDYIKALHGNYAELTKAIQDYYQKKEYNQKVEAIQGSEEAQGLQKQLEETLNQMNEDGAFDMKYSKAMIKSWSDTIAKEIVSGKIPNSLDSIERRIKEVFNAKNLSMYRNETYGEADLHDVMQALEKVHKAYGDITLETANAENALIAYQSALKNFDLSQLNESKKSLEEQRDSLKRDIERGYTQKDVYGNDSKYGTAISLSTEQLKEYKEKLNTVEAQIKAVEEAEGEWLANQYKDKVEELNNELFNQVKAYKDAKDAMHKLELQGKANSDEWKKQEKNMIKAKESANELGIKYGIDLKKGIDDATWSMIDSAETTYDLNKALNTLATKAFPKVSEFAMKSLSKLQEYLLKSKNTVYEWVKGILEWIPEDARDALGLNTMLTNVNKNLALTQKQLESLDKASDKLKEDNKETAKSIDGLVSEQAKKRAKEFGGNIKDIDTIISDSSKGMDAMAKELRSSAKIWEETAKSYRTSTNKNLWLETRSMTEEQIALLEKNAKTARALATDIAGEDGKSKSKKSSKGKDPWQERLSLFKELNTEYEKLLKNYSADESKQRIQLSYARAVAEIFAGQGKYGNIENWMGFDKSSMIAIGRNMLDTLKISPEKRKDLEKQLAGLKAEVDIKIQEDAVKDFEEYMQKVADNFELSETFRKLGVPIELTYSLGGKPTTLADQRKELEDNYYQIFKVQQKYGEDGVKAYDKIQEDIAKKEQKNLEERAKNYVKYLTESMGERAQIEIKAIQDINKIEEDATLDSFSKQQAIMQRRKKMNEELTKFDLDQLKSSDVYLSVFKDLEDASKEQLQYVIDKLKEMQTAFSDLSPAQVKSIANDIKKMEDAIASQDSTKNLFKNMRDAVLYARKRNDLLKEQTNLQKDVDSNNEVLSAAQEYLYELELKRKSIQDESSEEWQEANEKVIQQQKLIESLQNKIKELEEKLKGVTGEIDKGENALKGFTEGLGKIHQKMNQIKESLDAVFEGLDSMGLVNDAFRDTYESITEIIGGIDTFMSGLEQMDFTKPFTIVTGSIKAIGGIFQTIGGFFGIGDKKKEREIQRLVEKVDTLDKAYQRLEKSIEDAYAFSDYNAGYEQMQDNLEQQKNYYNEMVRLEEAKKKTDDEKIKEYKEKLEEIADAEDELRQSRHEMYGSTNDVWSEANNWVDAWLDAYKETGDGLDALNDSWDEFYENLVKKQATSAIVGSRMKDYIDRINAVIDSNMDEYGYVDAFKEIGEAFKADSAEWNKLLKEFFEYAGIKGGSGDFILSDLQKGIQNITEPQAAAIEAYLNSMRFAVFRHTEQLDTLIATIQMQYGSGAENPVVTELKGIRSVLDRIDSRLSSVINTRGVNPALRISGN